MNPLSIPLSPPIAPSAVYRLADLDALDALYAGAPGFTYARDSHPNSVELADGINALEAAAWGHVTGSGMAALSVALLATCPPGGTILAADQLYGKSFVLLRQFTRLGFRVKYADVSDLAALKLAAQASHVLLVESISNPLAIVTDLAAVATIAKNAGAMLIVDNTFAGPTVTAPLTLGADLVVESLTKLMNGHSDVTLGYLGGRDAKLASTLADLASTWGFFASPFDCWLARRGLETLAIRTEAAQSNARRIAAWLASRTGRVHYPGLGNMLAFELPGGRDAVNRFFRASPIPFAPSLGHTSTTLSYPWSTSHRAVEETEKLARGITPGLVRVSVGIEVYDALEAGLAAGFATLIP